MGRTTANHSRLTRLTLTLAGLLVFAGGLCTTFTSREASASVTHGTGLAATVAGWTSWYGSYAMGALGPAWCVDHGIPAPDPALAYRPTSLGDHSPDTTRAMGWIVGRYGPGADAVTAAAITLALHDLAGATYPAGRLDVDLLGPGALGGFASAAVVLQQARAMKHDGIAHAATTAPFAAHQDAVAGGGVAVTVLDGRGAPVSGAAVTPASGPSVRTGTDGRALLGAAAGPIVVTVAGTDVDAFAPTLAVAQRVIRPRLVTVRPAAPPVVAPAPPPSSTTTTSTTTSSTTSTTMAPHPSVPPTSPAGPPTPVGLRQAPPVPTTAPAPATTELITASQVSAVTPAASPPPVSATAALPVTGSPLRGPALVALGLVLLGAALVVGGGWGDGPAPGGSIRALVGPVPSDHR